MGRLVSAVVLAAFLFQSATVVGQVADLDEAESEYVPGAVRKQQPENPT